MRTAFFVFSRIDSSRLPGKALLSLGESTVLGTILTRLKSMEQVIPLVLTSERAIDDCIVGYAEKFGVSAYRGSLEDVSQRIEGAIKAHNIDAFFRINGDSPCLELNLLSKALELFESGHFDFVTNLVTRTFPYGVAVELFDANAYLKALPLFSKPEHKEHATSFFYENLVNYRYHEIINSQDGSNFSLTVDTLEDYLDLLKILESAPDFLEWNIDEKLKRLKETFYD